MGLMCRGFVYHIRTFRNLGRGAVVGAPLIQGIKGLGFPVDIYRARNGENPDKTGFPGDDNVRERTEHGANAIQSWGWGSVNLPVKVHVLEIADVRAEGVGTLTPLPYPRTACSCPSSWIC